MTHIPEETLISAFFKKKKKPRGVSVQTEQFLCSLDTIVILERDAGISLSSITVIIIIELLLFFLWNILIKNGYSDENRTGPVKKGLSYL